MIPILFSPNVREYNNNGLGVLVDVDYCTVTEERNGEFELKLQYPVSGRHYDDLAVDCQILAKANETGKPQAFRIYSISKPMNGIVTVSAEHVSYELSSIIVSPFSATSVGDALNKIKANSINENPFDFWTDKNTVATMSQNVLLSARSLLGGVSGSVLDVYTGEYEFDNYSVKLHKNRGTDNGVVISYSKNLTGVKCDERIDGVVTGAIAYWSAETDGILLSVYGDLQTIDTDLSYSRNIIVDCSSDFEDPPSIDALNERAREYVEKHKNIPYFSVSVEFVNLGDTEEYKQYKGLYRVNLCDTVTVKHPVYGIDVKAKVVKTVFDSVNEKYEKIQIGETSANISKTIASQEKEISKKIGRSDLEKAVSNATNSIAGNKGGYFVIYPSATNAQEVLFLDEPSVEEAKNVWRWNLSGLGHSSNGYNGPFGTAITADGQIVADFITAGELNGAIITAGTISADQISTGVLSSVNGYSYFSLNTGAAVFGGKEYNTTINQGGISQSLKSTYGVVGGLIPTGDASKYYESAYYVDGHSSGFSIDYQHQDESFSAIAVFDKNGVVLDKVLKVNNTGNTARGVVVYRTTTLGTNCVSLGVSSLKSNPSGCFDVYNFGNEQNSYTRLEFARSNGEAYVSIRGAIVDNGVATYSNDLELGKNMWFAGSMVASSMVASSFDVSSVERKKENIEEQQSVLQMFKGSKIYNFDYKEKKGKNKRVGFVIERETPECVICDDKEHINLYSMASLNWRATQELLERLESLEKRCYNNGKQNQNET